MQKYAINYASQKLSFLAINHMPRNMQKMWENQEIQEIQEMQ